MSSALAIAGVTYVLRDLLNDGLINNDLAANVKVTARPPAREPTATAGAQSQLNLFLYQISPNAALRTACLPSRDTKGARVTNAPLAVDLHYLLTAYDERDYHMEVLLGYAMQLLHENPGLSREQIRDSLQSDLSGSTGAGLPEELKKLKRCGLADQIESLKITPQYLSVDEMSKLWTCFQAPYRPSMTYQVTVILIEAEKPARIAMPVLTRGMGDNGFTVTPSLLGPLPELLAVIPANRQPASLADGKLKLFGRNLRGTNLRVMLRHARLDLQLELKTVTGANPALVVRAPDPTGADLAEQDFIPANADVCIVADLDQAQGVVAAGWHSIEVSVRLPGESENRISNPVAVAIAPRFATSGANKPVVTALPGGNYRVKLRCTPSSRPSQPVTLLLGQNELRPPDVITAPSATVNFEGPLPGPGNYLARLRVDGIDSLFINRSATAPPAFEPTQFINVP